MIEISNAIRCSEINVVMLIEGECGIGMTLLLSDRFHGKFEMVLRLISKDKSELYG